jgi:hypothetical protein
MSDRDPRFTAAVSELANSLQAAGPLVAELKRTLRTQADDAIAYVTALETTITRATEAVRQLQPPRP